MSLQARTISSVTWTTAAKVAQQAFQFGLSIVLMRLLGPKAFGLIGMVLVFSGFAAIFAQFGFAEALVQRQELREDHRSTSFWFNTGVAALLSLALFLAAGLIAEFYKEPDLKPLTAWLSLTFILNSPAIVPRALLQKELRFDTLAKVDVTALVVSGVTAVVVAVRGGGVWSLVVQQLASAGVTSSLLLALGHWHPRLVWSGRALRELFGFGAGLTGFNVINYWARSSDKLLIGKFIGSDALGLYSRAYALMLLPITQIISVLAPVMFPVLSTIQADHDRVKRAFLRVICLLTFVCFPMMLGLLVVAKPFVLGLLSAKWAGAIPLIQILSLVGITQTLCNPVGWIYTSQGRTDWMFWWGVGGSGFLILSIVVGILFGNVEAVALAYLIGNLIITVPCLSIPGKLIGMRVSDVWRIIRGNLFCALAMAISVWGIGNALPDHLPPLVQLCILVPMGALLFAAFAWFTHQPALEECIGLCQQMLSKIRTVRTELQVKDSPGNLP